MIDLTGHKYGRLSPTEYVGKNKHQRPMWRCKCDCGCVIITTDNALRRGNTTSCGCYQKEIRGKASKKHGMSKTAEYRIYHLMRYRCYNEKGDDFRHYGGRGIVICERWLESFENFIADMGLRPKGMNSIERIDVNGNYEPSNCKWATQQEQCNNKRINHLLTINGETKTIAEWSRVSGTSSRKIQDRIVDLGWSTEDAVFLPNKTRWTRRKKAELN